MECPITFEHHDTKDMVQWLCCKHYTSMQAIDGMVDSGRSFMCPFCRKRKKDIHAFVYEEEGRRILDVNFVEDKIVRRRRIVDVHIEEAESYEVIIVTSSDDEDSAGGSDE